MVALNMFLFYDLDVKYFMRKNYTNQNAEEMQYIRLFAAIIIFFSGLIFDQMQKRNAKLFLGGLILTYIGFKFIYDYHRLNDPLQRNSQFYNWLLPQARGLLFGLDKTIFALEIVIIFNWSSRRWFLFNASLIIFSVQVSSRINHMLDCQSPKSY